MANSPAKRVTIVVKADRSGKLVRVVKVSPSMAPPTVKPAAAPPPAVQAIVDSAAQKHGVDPLLVQSVIAVESNFNQYANSPKGAQGLMQLMPETAKRFGVSNTFDANENIEAGVKYLKFLQERYQGDVTLALAAYNAGEGAVDKYHRSTPPYRETQEYVVKVGQKYEKAKQAAAPKHSAAAAAAAPSAPPAPEFRHVEMVTDAEGRLSLRTR